MKTTFRSLFLSALMLTASGIALQAQTSREEMAADPASAGGVYYAYRTDFAPQTPAPKGYKPFYISHYGRHGSRYLLNDRDYKGVLDMMEEADKKGVLTPLGKDALGRLRKVWAEAEGHGDELAPLGVRQHRGIAERMYGSFPEVFKGARKVSARATTSIRVILSMDAFCERIKELNPQLQITREASRSNMYYLNHHDEEHEAFNSRGSWHILSNKFSAKLVKSDRFVHSIIADDDYILRNVYPDDLMWKFFWVMADAQDMETDVRFYDLFTSDELFDLWQIQSLGFYVRDGNCPLNEGLAMKSCKPLLRNFVTTAQKVIAGQLDEAATLRFGHDGNIIPLAAILQLDGCNAQEDRPEEVYKVWSDWKVAPMAANIQLIFYRKAGSDDVLVKFMHNENEKTIPIESDCKPYYHWRDVEKFYLGILAE